VSSSENSVNGQPSGVGSVAAATVAVGNVVAGASEALAFVGGAAGEDPARPVDPAVALEPGTPPQWPMPVETFLSGAYLQRSDVVLTRKNRDFRSWLIRFATKGSFSHAALVFLVPYQEKGFNNSFVIESASGGVDLTNFADYVNDRRSVIGIKRLRKPWFNDEVQCDVRGRMLNMIKSTYNYATIVNLGMDFLRDLTFGMKTRIYGPSRAIQSTRRKALTPPNKFICSGLVQLGFMHTLLDLAIEKRLPPQFLSDIVFREDLRSFLPQDWDQFTPSEQEEILYDFIAGFSDLLEATTPEDLAVSPELEWVYIIRRGKVYPVQNDAQVRELLAWRPRRRRAQ